MDEMENNMGNHMGDPMTQPAPEPAPQPMPMPMPEPEPEPEPMPMPEPDPMVQTTAQPMAEPMPQEEIEMELSAPDRKVRKNVLDTTLEERKAYVEAIKQLKNTYREGSEISLYDEFVVIHVESMGFGMAGMNHDMSAATGPAADAGVNAGHLNPVFIPWHRELLARLEKALQEVSGNPNFTVPYWDWTDPRSAEVLFTPEFLGGNGQGDDYTLPPIGDGTPPQNIAGGTMQNGPFTKENGWVLDPRIHSDPFDPVTRGDALKRYRNAAVYSSFIPKQEIENLLKVDDPNVFFTAMEGDIRVIAEEDGNFSRDEAGKLQYDEATDADSGGFFHNYVHDYVGGSGRVRNQETGKLEYLYKATMNSLASPYDPVFWFHHSNVDRLWAEWQAKGHYGPEFYATDNYLTPEVGLPFGHNLNDPMWPWDGNLSKPAYVLAEVDGMPRIDFDRFFNDYSKDVVRVSDTLDFVNRYDFSYDTLVTRLAPAPTLSAENLFNPVTYLKQYSDVANAVNSGVFSSARAHFMQSGLDEGRNPGGLFDKYLQDNPDVNAAVAAGLFKNGYDHFIKQGIREARGLTKDLSGLEAVYKFLYQDVAQAVRQGTIGSGIEHLIRFGMSENRDPFQVYNLIAENFDGAYYEARNADVTAAVQRGEFRSFLEHFVIHGMFEKDREFSRVFSNRVYGVNNADVADAVNRGVLGSNFQHYVLSGFGEGRATSAGTAVSFKAAKTSSGTTGDDVLTGGFGDDDVSGDAGDDLLEGGAGDDTHTGGAGRDVFVLARGAGTDTVTDFVVGEDQLGLSGGLTFSQLAIAQGIGTNAQDTLIVDPTSRQVLAILSNVQASSLAATSFATV